jgi:2-oxoglutarate ferredoxin oxidoreductase subunit gamma
VTVPPALPTDPPTSAPGTGDAPAPARTGLLADRDFVEVRFGGSGGQGVLLMGVLLAVAANRDHRSVVQTESYGPEARGGFSRSDVIISDQPIDYPKLDEADLLVALSQDSVNGYLKSVRRNGVLIYDCSRIPTPPDFRGTTIGIPFGRLAKEQIGRSQTTNVLALGAVVRLTGIVSEEAIRAAVIEAVPAGTEEINAKALALGLTVTPEEYRQAVL